MIASSALNDLLHLARQHRRPNHVDTEWVARPEELEWRKNPDLDDLLAALHGADTETARYLLWLALPVIADADLPEVCAGAKLMTEPDARLLAFFFLLGRAKSAPPWWVEVAKAALPELERRTTRKMEAILETVQGAVAHPEHYDLEGGLKEGARLFNAGEYFQAHEVWEGVWRPQRGPERDFYQGLINLAVAMNKVVERNPNGVMRLVHRADSLLAPFTPAHRGVDVAAIRRQLDVIGAQALAWREGKRDGIDASAIPKLPV